MLSIYTWCSHAVALDQDTQNSRTLWLYIDDSKGSKDQCDGGFCQHDVPMEVRSTSFIST